MYGYSADVISPFQAESKTTITTHGNDFLVALTRKIPKDIPIIFIAHSLGGILVKDVYVLTYYSDCKLTHPRSFSNLGII
jgi:hypothetical protein